MHVCTAQSFPSDTCSVVMHCALAGLLSCLGLDTVLYADSGSIHYTNKAVREITQINTAASHDLLLLCYQR